ncbi:hypothetical protein GCM10027570_09210 [Streptomonospora sediminis]
MTTAPSAPSAPPAAAKPRGELIVAALVALVGAVLLIRTATMDVPGTGGYLGPQFFPYVIGSLLVVLSVLLAVQHLRPGPAGPSGAAAGAGSRTGPESKTESEADSATTAEAEPAAESGAGGTPAMSWKPFGIVAATLALHLVLLEPVGWLITGAGLFFGVSYALGGRRVLRDLGISIVMSAAAQVGFSAGLGIALPAGILGGVV